MGHPGKLVIKQRFSGIDEHGHLTIDTELEGRVPEVAVGSSVHIEPYTELYHYSRDGEGAARHPHGLPATAVTARAAAAPGLRRGKPRAVPPYSCLPPVPCPLTADIAHTRAREFSTSRR